MAKNEIIYENSYVFPSPSSDAATLKYKISDNSEATCIVYDVLSRKVIKFTLSPKKTEYRFSVEKINEGIYYYKIISNGNLKGFGKFSVIR